MTKTTRYIGLLDGKKGAYGIVVPDLPGCVAMGKTVDEALRNAVAAATDWAEDALADGERLPLPRTRDAILADKDIAKEIVEDGAVLVMVPLLLDSGRSTKANLSLDSGLLKAIDEAAEERGLTRSTFVASAMREKIAAEG